MPDPSLRGRFVWHELMAADTKAAIEFYSKIVGWNTQSWPQDPSYTMFVVGKKPPMAGLMLLPEEARQMGAPPHWLSYVGTDDVDETVAQASGLGAKVLHGPVDIPTVGRFAVLQDPQGAVFAVFSSTKAGGSGAQSGVGDFSWHELATTDVSAALRFYQELFGWEATDSMDMGPEAGVYQMFGHGGRSVGGIYAKPAGMPGPNWLPYIQVRDSKKAAATVGKIGGTIVNGPMEVPGGDWIAQGLDPQGAFFAVHSVKPAQPAPAPSRAKAPAESTMTAKKPASAKPSTSAPKASKNSTSTAKRAKAPAKTVPKRKPSVAVAARKAAKGKTGSGLKPVAKGGKKAAAKAATPRGRTTSKAPAKARATKASRSLKAAKAPATKKKAFEARAVKKKTAKGKAATRARAKKGASPRRRR